MELLLALNIINFNITGRKYDNNKLTVGQLKNFGEEIPGFKAILNDFLCKLGVKFSKLLSVSHQFNEKAMEAFVNYFKKVHREVLYINEDVIRAECQRRGFNYNQLDFNFKSKLPVNACFSPDCPLFLKPKTKEFLKSHLSVWGKYPKDFHQIIYQNIHLNPEEIQALFSTESKSLFGISNLPPGFENVSAYIENVKKSFMNK